MNKEQSKTMWLADALETINEHNADSLLALNVIRQAGPELRRLHAENEELRAQIGQQEPLLQRIAELEKALKLVQQHHATAWNRGHIAGMAANRMVAQDALNAVKKDAWNNTQLTEALMTAEGRCEELERQLEEARKQISKLNEAHESTIYLYSLPK